MLCVRHTQVRPAAGIIGPQNRLAITLQYMGPGPKVDANLELSDSQPYWWSDIPNDACLELVITMASSPLATYRHHVVCVKKSTLTKSQSQVWFSLYIYVYLQLSSFIYHQLVCFYKWLMWVCSVGKESIVGSICIRNYRSLLWGASCFIFIDILHVGSEWVSSNRQLSCGKFERAKAESTLQYASQWNSSRLCLMDEIVLLFVYILMFGAVKPMQRR